MPAPLVSVIMPCLDAGRMLHPAIESVVEQTYPAIEIIFVDNGSRDSSLTIAKDWASKTDRPFRIIEVKEPGCNRARNFGYGLASGEYIQWMDADDHMHPEKIARQVEVLQRQEELDAVYGDWILRRFLPGGPPHVRHTKPIYLKDQITRTLAQVWYPPHAYLFRRAAAERLQVEQAWWPDRPVATDIEYTALAALLGLRFAYVPGSAVVYNHWSPTQMGGRFGWDRRLPALRAIYARLDEVAARPEIAPRVTSAHRYLLHQDWGLWRMAPEAIAFQRLEGRRVRLSHRTNGRTLDMRPREAAIAEAMVGSGGFSTLCHKTLHIADRLPGMAEGHVAVLRTLHSFAEAGLLESGEA
jgi:glycosyltransferase involved in cell wall biosynthesis